MELNVLNEQGKTVEAADAVFGREYNEAPLPVSAVVASPCDNGHTAGITLHAPIYADCTGGFKSAWYGCSVCDHQVDTSGNDVPWSPSSCPD